MKLEIFIAPAVGSVVAVVFAKPKSILDAVGRIGCGVFSGFYFSPVVAKFIDVTEPELQAAISAGLGLFGFFIIEAVLRIIKNINSIKDLKGK